MTGHAPAAAVEAVRAQAGRGFTFMLPTPDAVWVGEELAPRFGLPYWQFAVTATDANRFAIRLARAVTGRPKILIFNWCYHGSVDETFATLRDSQVVARDGNLGPPVDPGFHTERYMHLAALNRGILLTPFHNMALIAPAVAESDIDRHTEVFRESVRAGRLYH